MNLGTTYHAYYQIFEFNEHQPELNHGNERNDLLSKNGISTLKINTIEVTDVKTPSEITLRLDSDSKTYFFPFHTTRCNFLFQNGVFILDTCGTENLEFNVKNPWSIRIVSDNPFHVTLYCVGTK